MDVVANTAVGVDVLDSGYTVERRMVDIVMVVGFLERLVKDLDSMVVVDNMVVVMDVVVVEEVEQMGDLDRDHKEVDKRDLQKVDK